MDVSVDDAGSGPASSVSGTADPVDAAASSGPVLGPPSVSGAADPIVAAASPEPVLGAADLIAPGNDEDGVARVLEALMFP